MRPFIVILLLHVSFGLSGQPGISNIEKYTTLNGLTENAITGLLQDKQGYIWVATTWGLNRYDSRSFKQYIRTPDGKAIGIVNSIAEDTEGNIWFSTDEGIKILNPFTGDISETLLKGNLFEDREKNIWIIRGNSVSLLNNKQVIKKTELDITAKDIRANSYISDLYEDSKKNIWIASAKGLIKLDKKTFASTNYYFTEDNRQLQNSCTSIYEDEDGAIWAGTWGGGLLKFNPTLNRCENFIFNHPTDGRLNIIFSIIDFRYDQHTYLLLGTEAGFVIIDKPHSCAIHIEKIINKDERNSELNASVTGIFPDKQNNLWLTTASGLYKIDKGKQPFNWVSLPADHDRDLIFHVVEDIRYPDSIVYLTSIQGWWKLDLRSRSIQKHLLPVTKHRLAENINHYIKDENGIWFTSQGGFGYYDIRAGKIYDYTELVMPGKNSFRRSWYIVKDHAGKIWVSVFRAGLRIFDPVTRRVTSLFTDSSSENLTGKSITGLVIDGQNIIWMKAGEKLYRIQPANHSYTSYPVPGESFLYLDQHKRLLIFNERKIYEFREAKLHPLYPLTGETDFRILKINEDGAGNFWIQTHNGYYKVSPDFKTWTSYTAYTDFTSIEISEIFNRGDRFIATATGKVLHFDLKEIARQTISAPVFISRLTTGNQNFLFPSAQHSAITLSYKSKIEIEIAALNFLNEQGNRLFYQLQGWDNQWNELTTGSVLHYEQLPPGHYKFLVKAINGDVQLNSGAAELNFTIHPPFWKTGWFISLCILAVSLILYLIYHYRLQQALKMERMRTRIATDLHDDIGATLSSISMYSDAVKNQVKDQLPHLEPVLNKMGENSRSMVSSMSDIVWAINPDNDDGEKLVHRMESYARDICAVRGIQLYFSGDEKMNELKLPLEHRKNIYLVFKETLNNALKYSEAKEIAVSISRNRDTVHLIIKDNGKGFDATTAPKGNGLKNMRLRAKEINAALKITSSQNEGTLIELTCHA